MTEMKNKVKKALSNNFSLKLIAVIIAAVVWLIVVNVSDPEKTIILYNVPVTVTDEEVVSDMGMVYEVIEGGTLNITITGKRSVLNDLSSEDFIATASLKEMSKVNAIPIEVMAKNSNVRNKISIDKQSEQSVIVALENVEEDTFDIAVEYKGSTAENYTASGCTLSENTVDISAPASVLDKIDKVVAVCKLDNQDQDFTTNCKIVLYDRNGNKIKGDNIYLSTKTVDVTVEVLYEKEVPLIVEIKGNPETGYEIENTSYSQSTVVLKGKEDVLANMNSLSVDANISVEGETEDVYRTIDLTEYLPEGIYIEGESEIDVVVKISQLTNTTITLEEADIDINNIPEGLTIDSVKNVKVILRGNSETIEKITAKELNASIDLSGKKEGKSKVNVSITIPEGTELVEDVVATVVLR